MKSLLKKLLGLPLAVVESARFEEPGRLVVSVRPRKSRRLRCPVCGRRCPAHGAARPRRWRSLDLGSTMVFLECAVRRVMCPEHGALVESVPWAHPRSRFTAAFEDQVAWLCVHASRSVVAELMRIDWKSVGGVCARVYGRLEAAAGGRFAGLARIGIDETSYRKGQRYMTVVIDHGSGRVVWCGEGHGRKVLESFFALLDEEQRASIEVVTADGARWIADVVAEQCPNARRVMDPFHVVGWMTDLLDELRKRAFRDALKKARDSAPEPRRGRPRKGEKAAGRARAEAAEAARGGRFALLKNPEDLTGPQRLALERIAREDGRLYRAYLLKERLRDVFKAPGAKEAAALLDSWLRSACRSGCAEVRELSKKVRRHREAIVLAVELGISNARVEAINNKIKLTIRMGYGFRNIGNLIALVMLRCSNLPIALPGRAA